MTARFAVGYEEMEKAHLDWQYLRALGETSRFKQLDVDCLAVGTAVVEHSAVQIEEILYLDGEIHEEPQTLQSHCASLLAVWNAVRAPSLVDLGQCSCVGRRLLMLEPRFGRRFAIHAIELGGPHLIFAVMSSVSRWEDVELVKSMSQELATAAANVHHAAGFTQSEAATQAPEFEWYLYTAREIEILKLLAGGLSNKQIARELGSSPNTVRNQIHALFRKADVTNRTELALRVATAT
ncbi:LuxR C-terminal-related transcriptional regulator [Chitiniphilus purpureus]|uniref:LuxR C-terminal-related transcriptional regulator n=1 Tax=Chitiniphilus purpureus TaxID=2981137 RepID=A0ABY6DNG4_9NEIS|nr:LuxR C-terminal-related transcriptional regulator [Chitiniphilus sp. CD1]UXY15877.1 LuxR C-terminal-related transcriptional regulator [Chitiniphilus sp. CD1]